MSENERRAIERRAWERIVKDANDNKPKISGVPDDIARTVAELGFEIQCWDQGEAAVSGHGQEFIGSSAEVRAYLTAWSACLARASWQSDQDKAIEENQSRLIRFGLVLASNGPIEAGATAQIWARPQSGPYRGDRIVVPDEIAGYFEICDLRVGNRSQFPQAQAMPASLCAARIDRSALFGVAKDETAAHVHSVRITIAEAALAEFGRPWTMETCQTAMDLTIVVRNRSDLRWPFECMIIGRGSR